MVQFQKKIARNSMRNKAKLACLGVGHSEALKLTLALKPGITRYCSEQRVKTKQIELRVILSEALKQSKVGLCSKQHVTTD